MSSTRLAPALGIGIAVALAAFAGRKLLEGQTSAEGTTAGDAELRGPVAHYVKPLHVHKLIQEHAPTADLCAVYRSWEPASLCPQGEGHWSREELMASLPDFARLYAGRPVGKNLYGMGTNHAFALWFTVRKLRPKHIIESGVYLGQGTWLLRQAAGPEARIYSLDPFDRLLFRDDGGRTRYFVEDTFTDFADVDWASLIPESERSETLVVLDDHMACSRRLQEAQAHGFRHLWTDDNSRHSPEEYTFSTLCTPLPASTPGVVYRDYYFEQYAKVISLAEHQANLERFLNASAVYFEFPPVLDGCGRGPPGLLETEEQALGLGLPSISEEAYRYAHTHPPYVQLREAAL